MSDEPNLQEIPLVTGPTRIKRARLYPYPDLTRLWLRVDLSPFSRPPNLTVSVRGPDGALVSEMDLIQWRDPRISLTMHLRRPPQPGATYRAELILTELQEDEEVLLDRTELEFPLEFVEPDQSDL
ncbi:MAG: hypothetical protein Kow0047_32960 [Anaerolineae bacterium]